MSDAARLVAALTARGWTIGVAESLTGGALSAEIVTVPGASATLLGGVVAYATPVHQSMPIHWWSGSSHQLSATPWNAVLSLPIQAAATM